MPMYNKFENQIDEILDEGLGPGDIWNATTKAVNKITGSNFKWQGLVTNSYEPEKNYYPNIRKGWGGVFANKKKDAADQLFLEYIAKYRTPPFPDNILSDKDSPKPPVTTNPHQIGMKESFKTIIEHLLEADNTPGQIKPLPRAVQKRTFKADTTNPGPEAKTVVQNMEISRRGEIQQKKQATYKRNKTKEQQDQDAAAAAAVEDIIQRQSLLGTNFIDVELWESSNGKTCRIYKDLWPDFLTIVQNAVVGASQREYSAGASPYSILREEGGRIPRGTAKYTSTRAIQPKLLQAFHEQIMKPLFLSKPNDVLLYATTEQWKSVSAGSSVYKGAVGALGQVMSAGRNAPKVTL